MRTVVDVALAALSLGVRYGYLHSFKLGQCSWGVSVRPRRLEARSEALWVARFSLKVLVYIAGSCLSAARMPSTRTAV